MFIENGFFYDLKFYSFASRGWNIRSSILTALMRAISLKVTTRRYKSETLGNLQILLSSPIDQSAKPMLRLYRVIYIWKHSLDFPLELHRTLVILYQTFLAFSELWWPSRSAGSTWASRWQPRWRWSDHFLPAVLDIIILNWQAPCPAPVWPCWRRTPIPNDQRKRQAVRPSHDSPLLDECCVTYPVQRPVYLFVILAISAILFVDYYSLLIETFIKNIRKTSFPGWSG